MLYYILSHPRSLHHIMLIIVQSCMKQTVPISVYCWLESGCYQIWFNWSGYCKQKQTSLGFRITLLHLESECWIYLRDYNSFIEGFVNQCWLWMQTISNYSVQFGLLIELVHWKEPEKRDLFTNRCYYNLYPDIHWKQHSILG